MVKRGRILRDTNIGAGMLTVEGVQYTFTLENMWRSDVPPRTGMTVDVQFNADGAPEAVHAVSEGQIAKELAQKTLSGALRQGETVGSGMKARFGVVLLVVEALLLISFFLLPNLLVGDAFRRRALTGWEAVGLDMATQMPNDHGLLSLLAIVCLFAPIAVPFLKIPLVRWLFIAPLSFVVIALITLYSQVQNVGRAASQGMGELLGGAAARQMSHEITGMFTPSLGAYLVLICSVYFATRTFKFRG